MKEICDFDFKREFEAWLIKNADNNASFIKKQINAIDKICQNTSLKTLKAFKQKHLGNKSVSQIQNSCQNEDVVRNSSYCDWHDILIC